MNIKIERPASVFGQGQRDNMEDCISPVHGKAGIDDRLFIVCDGMGGHAKGEVASTLACEGFTKLLQGKRGITSESAESELLTAFNEVQRSYDEYTETHPESAGMGTTVVLSLITSVGIIVLHCGDSRLYHIRNSKIYWKTIDHSLVASWVQQGFLTEEEAENHPRKNVITAALHGNISKPVMPSIHIITDLRAGDWIFLTTDGIRESVNDRKLLEIIGSETSIQEKTEYIESLCRQNSRDNYSCYLIRIESID